MGEAPSPSSTQPWTTDGETAYRIERWAHQLTWQLMQHVQVELSALARHAAAHGQPAGPVVDAAELRDVLPAALAGVARV